MAITSLQRALIALRTGYVRHDNAIELSIAARNGYAGAAIENALGLLGHDTLPGMTCTKSACVEAKRCSCPVRVRECVDSTTGVRS